MEEEEISGRRASVPCKGKSTGDKEKVEEGRERKGGMHGQAMRSAARMEEEFNRKRTEEHCERGVPEEVRLLELEWC